MILTRSGCWRSLNLDFQVLTRILSGYLGLQNSSDSRTAQIPEQLGFQNTSDSRTARIRTVANSKMSQHTGTMSKLSPRVDDEGPIRINPASATISPTVGANCRGGNTQMPRGRLSLGPNVRLRIRGGIARWSHTRRTLQTQRSTLLRGPREEVKPLLQHLSYFGVFPSVYAVCTNAPQAGYLSLPLSVPLITAN